MDAAGYEQAFASHKDRVMKCERYFHCLDALKFIGAVLIARLHFLPDFPGYLAVDFFFLVSGFLLASTYIHREKKARMFSGLVIAKLARLMPVHLVTLVLYFISLRIFHDLQFDYDGQALFVFLQHVTLTQNVGLDRWGLTFNQASWYISVLFWLSLVCAAYITEKTRSLTLLLMSLTAFVFLFTQSGHLDHHAGNFYGVFNSGLLRGLASMLLGILCYRLFIAIDRQRCNIYAVSVIEALSLMSLFWLFYINRAAHQNVDYVAPALFFVAVFIFALERGCVSLCLAKLSFLGKYAYSFFMVHLSVLPLTHHLLHDFQLEQWQLFLAFSLLTGVCAILLYHLIERRAGRLIRRAADMVVKPELPRSAPKITHPVDSSAGTRNHPLFRSGRVRRGAALGRRARVSGRVCEL